MDGRKPLFAVIYMRIIISGFLGSCRISSIHCMDALFEGPFDASERFGIFSHGKGRFELIQYNPNTFGGVMDKRYVLLEP